MMKVMEGENWVVINQKLIISKNNNPCFHFFLECGALDNFFFFFDNGALENLLCINYCKYHWVYTSTTIWCKSS